MLRNTFSEDSLVGHLRSVIEPDWSKLAKAKQKEAEEAETAVDDRGAFSDANLKGDLALHDELVFYPPYAS